MGERIKLASAAVLVTVAMAWSYYVFYFAVSRLNCQTVIEINEDVSAELTRRIVQGSSIFDLPSYEFAGSCYPPLYFWIWGGLVNLTGIESGFFLGRMVSVVSTLLCGLAIFGNLRENSVPVWTGIVAIGLFFASYDAVDCWFDVARVDMLWMATLGLAFWILSTPRGVLGRSIGWGVVLGGMLIKQTTGFFLLAVCLVEWMNYEKRVWLPLLLSGLVSLMYVLLDSGQPGLWFYTVKLLSQQKLDLGRTDQFLNVVGLSLSCTLVLLFLRVGCSGPPSRPGRLLSRVIVFLGFSLTSGVVGSLKVGGSVNHFIPFFYFNALIVGVLISLSWQKRGGMTGSLITVVGLVLLSFLVFVRHFGRADRQLIKASKDEPLSSMLTGIAMSNRRVFCLDVRVTEFVRAGGLDCLVHPQALIDLSVSGESELVWNISKELSKAGHRDEIGYVVAPRGGLEDGYREMFLGAEMVFSTETGNYGVVEVWRLSDWNGVRGAER